MKELITFSGSKVETKQHTESEVGSGSNDLEQITSFSRFMWSLLDTARESWAFFYLDDARTKTFG